MSFAEKVAVLKVVNAAFREYDSKSGSIREINVQKRKVLRANQEAERQLMSIENDLAFALRFDRLEKIEARRLSVQRKKDELRLLRELAARLPEDEIANLKNETFIQRELRLKDQKRLLLRDQIDDVHDQSLSMEEGSMSIAMNWIYSNVDYKHVLKYRLKKPLLKLSRSLYYSTQLVLIKYIEILLNKWIEIQQKQQQGNEDPQEEDAESSDDDEFWSEDEEEEEEEAEAEIEITTDGTDDANTTDNLINTNNPSTPANTPEQEDLNQNDIVFNLIILLLTKTTTNLSDPDREIAPLQQPPSKQQHQQQQNTKTNRIAEKEKEKNEMDCRTLSEIHVKQWKKLQIHFEKTPDQVQRIIKLGLIPSLMIFTKSKENDVRHEASICLKNLTVKYCFADTALLLVRSGAVEAVISLARGLSGSSSSSNSNDKRNSAATGLNFDIAFVQGDALAMKKKDEERERDVRNNCLAFLSNISRYTVVSSRIVKRNGLACVIDCIKWDRYSSRNRHESDLLHVVALGIVKRCLIASDKEICLNCLKRNGPHDEKGGESLQLILSKMLERTHETIMMRVLPSFTQMDTTITIRKYVVEILTRISNSTPESVEIEIESSDEEEDEKSESAVEKIEMEKRNKTPRMTTIVPLNSLTIDSISINMLDLLHVRITKELNRLHSRIPSLPIWTMEEKNNISKQKQKRILQQYKLEMKNKTTIALQETIFKLKYVDQQSNLLRVKMKPSGKMTQEEEIQALLIEREEQLNIWSIDVHRRISRLVELWPIHFACNPTTMKEGGARLCSLLDMILIDPEKEITVTAINSINKISKQKSISDLTALAMKDSSIHATLSNANEKQYQKTQAVLKVLEVALPILRHCWESNVYKTEHLANCYCRSIFILSHHVSTGSSHLIRLVRREDLNIAKEVVRLKGKGASKRWWRLSSSLKKMTDIVHLRRDLMQFNVTPMMLGLVQQADETLQTLMNGKQETEMETHEKNDSEDNENSENSDLDELNIKTPYWENIMLCRRSSLNIASALYSLSISIRTRKWLIGKGMLMSLRRMTSTSHDLETLLVVSQVLEQYCEDRTAAEAGVKEGIIDIIDSLMETLVKKKNNNSDPKTNQKKNITRSPKRRTNEHRRNGRNDITSSTTIKARIHEISTRCLVKICSHGIVEPLNQILELCTHALEVGCSKAKVRACVISMAYFSESPNIKKKRMFFTQTHLKDAMWSLSLVDNDVVISERISRLLSSIAKNQQLKCCQELFGGKLYRSILRNVTERATTTIAKTCCLQCSVLLKESQAKKNEKVMVFGNKNGFLMSTRNVVTVTVSKDCE